MTVGQLIDILKCVEADRNVTIAVSDVGLICENFDEHFINAHNDFVLMVSSKCIEEHKRNG